MRFNVEVSDLRRALNTCNEVVPASSSIAEEQTGVLIRARKDNTVVFSATDGNVAVRVEVSAKVEEPGDVLVKCYSVANSVNAGLKDFHYDEKVNTVNVSTTSEDNLRIVGHNRLREGQSLPYNAKFPLLNTDFYKETPVFDETKATKFSALQFIEGFNKVSHAAGKDVNKLQFNCISLSLTDKDVAFAATDGTQIAEYRKAAQVVGLRGSFILGLRFASLVSKSINPALDEGNVYLYSENDKFFIRSGRTSIVGALVDIAFPAYVPFINTDGKKVATFHRADFLFVLQSIQPTVDSKSHRLALDAKSQGTAAIFTSSSSGEAEVSGFEVKTLEDFNLHFDSVLINNAIRNLDGDTFRFFFEDNSKGVIFKSEEDDSFTAFVCTLKKI